MIKNRIGILRKEAGLNQRELGLKIGVGQTTISAWETGKNEPDNESMHKMSQLFHVSIGYLTGYENNRRESLSEAEREQFETEEIKTFLERQEQIQDMQEDCSSDIFDTNLYEEWLETDQTTYFEIFQINKIGDYLTQEQRERLLNVAMVMFPNAVKGLFTDETPHK